MLGAQLFSHRNRLYRQRHAEIPTGERIHAQHNGSYVGFISRYRPVELKIPWLTRRQLQPKNRGDCVRSVRPEINPVTITIIS